jgi:hypothetical protein
MRRVFLSKAGKFRLILVSSTERDKGGSYGNLASAIDRRGKTTV